VAGLGRVWRPENPRPSWLKIGGLRSVSSCINGCVRLQSVHQVHRSPFTSGPPWRDNGIMPSRKPKLKLTAWRSYYLCGKKCREVRVVTLSLCLLVPDIVVEPE
jgi:hypothetical protein